MNARALLLGGVLLTQVAGCSSPEQKTLSFDARAGEACEGCDTCKTSANTCVCNTCTDFAQDAAAKTMLVCTRGLWTVYRSCPGGVSVKCASGGYVTSCLDANGKEIG
jgi:hypothetical protein